MMMFAVTTSAGFSTDPRGHDPERRRERAAGDLLVERREPPPRHHELQPVDADRGPERDRDHGRGAAEQDRDARTHRAPGERDRPPRRAVTRGHDPGEPGACPRQVDAAGDDVANQVVDEREVLVVDVALLDLPRLEERRLLRACLVAHRQRRERDVDVGVPGPEVPGQGLHRGGDVRGTGAGGQQDLPHPQTEVDRQVQGSCLEHARNAVRDRM
jgi:hypothetical protein